MAIKRDSAGPSDVGRGLAQEEQRPHQLLGLPSKQRLGKELGSVDGVASLGDRIGSASGGGAFLQLLHRVGLEHQRLLNAARAEARAQVGDEMARMARQLELLSAEKQRLKQQEVANPSEAGQTSLKLEPVAVLSHVLPSYQPSEVGDAGSGAVPDGGPWPVQSDRKPHCTVTIADLPVPVQLDGTGAASPGKQSESVPVTTDSNDSTQTKLYRGTTHLSDMMRSHQLLRKREAGPRSGLRRTIHSVVQTSHFGTFSFSLVLLNAVLLGVAWNQVAVNRLKPSELPEVYNIANVCFSLWFLLELLARFVAQGWWSFVKGPERHWNLFDVIVVIGDLVDTFISLVSQGDVQSSGITVLRVLRIARITRAVRVVRMVRFFRELRMMVVSVLSCGWSLLWSMMLFFIILYIFGMYFTQVVQSYLEGINWESDDIIVLEDQWGSLPRGWYTLFMGMSGGISWGEISNPLFSIHWVHVAVVVLYIFFTFFVVANIITGVLVDSVLQSANSDRQQIIEEAFHDNKKNVKQLTEIFSEADLDRSGMLSLEELESHLQNKEVMVLLHSIGLHTDDARELFELLDCDNSGEVSIDEFVRGSTRLKGFSKAVDLARFLQEFRRFEAFVKDSLVVLSEPLIQSFHIAPLQLPPPVSPLHKAPLAVEAPQPLPIVKPPVVEPPSEPLPLPPMVLPGERRAAAD